jgi:XTP/dITP diphosphohydrolase
LKLLVATRNPGKLNEIRAILGDLSCEIVSLTDFPEVAEPEETGASFTENASLKARWASDATGLLTLADDSGLEVDALDGKPGVKSRRFAGEETPFPEKMRKILSLLHETQGKGRTARFRCVAALADPATGVGVWQGVCEGEIAGEMRGNNGFGYDPIFYYPPLGKTFAELTPEEKNRVSHRAMALGKAKAAIMERLRQENPAEGKEGDQRRNKGISKQG